MLRYTTFETPLWEIILVGDEQGLAHLHMVTGAGKRTFTLKDSWTRDDAFFADAQKQLLEYFAGKRTEFTLPLNPQGTAFQKKVWQTLRALPFGTTCTYKDIATAMGNPKAARAVGMANSRNPIPLIVPCHRVIGAGGRLAGFAHGIEAKAALLDFEKTPPTP